MNSLQEISAFVGMQPLSMHGVGDLIPILSANAKTSMQAMIRELQSLPAITLEAEAVGNRFGDAPFRPTFRIHPSAGAVTKTEIILFANGAQPDLISIVGNAGDFAPFTLTIPGIFLLQIRRTGVQSTGVVVLTKNFHIEVVQPPPPPQTPPSILVERSGPADKMRFKVTGTGFLPNQPASRDGITVRVVDGVNNQDFIMLFTGSDSDGRIRLETGPLDTGLLKRNSLGQAKISFSATDKRRNPNSVPANEPLFSNVISFTF